MASIVELCSASYALNGRALVEDISFTIQSGETIVLLGRSGSGKTTTLKLMNRLLEPTSGAVFVEGKRTTDWDPIRLRADRMGMSFKRSDYFRTSPLNAISPWSRRSKPGPKKEPEHVCTRCSRSSASTPNALPAGFRVSFPEGSASASESRAPLQPIPLFFCSTSRLGLWIRLRVRKSKRNSALLKKTGEDDGVCYA